MVDQLIGLLLLGLGIHTNIPQVNPNVMGDETTSTQEFHLNPQNFQIGNHVSTASEPGRKRTTLDTRAFGRGIMTIQGDFLKRTEASRAAARKEFNDRKTAFKQQLVHIKDTKKQAVVDKLNTNCQNINEKRTDKMTSMLEKLSTILTKVTDRSASASAAGKDTATVDTAVTAAQAAIADAQTAVASQAGQVCTISISTSSANLKTDVGKTLSGLEQNLKSVYEKVIAAKKAVSSAISALAHLVGETS